MYVEIATQSAQAIGDTISLVYLFFVLVLFLGGAFLGFSIYRR